MDILEYARTHRYRVRNLHDGHPVSPARHRKKMQPGVGHWGSDAYWAIIGARGHITSEGDRIQVFLSYSAKNHLAAAVNRLGLAGGTVEHLGDLEAILSLPEADMETALHAIQAYRPRPGGPGRSAEFLDSIRPLRRTPDQGTSSPESAAG